MKWLSLVLPSAVVLGACGGAGDNVIDGGSSSSSESGTQPSTSVGSTEPSSSSDTNADTTCSEICDDSGSSSDASTGLDTSSSSGGGSSGEGTTTTDASSSGSSEGTVGVCGDGVVEGVEDCDDSGQSAACDDDCTFATCGDETVNPMANETCDAGGESFGCDVDCTLPECGDGLTNASTNELCDDGGPSPACDDDCTMPSCGDGNANVAALETCDDGNNDSNDGCSSECHIEGDFGGACRIVAGTQWCFDDDHCGQACEDVCTSLGLTIAADDGAWFAAQDTVAECQAISDAFGMPEPIAFDASPLGCLEDSGLDDVVGGGLTGGLLCSSDPSCPAAHRTAMDDLGVVCNLPDARRSVCPCEGAFCGNGLLEPGEECDDGNQVGGDGCTSSCSTGPDVCDGGVDPGSGDPYVVCAVDGTGAWVSMAEEGVGGNYHPVLICQELGYETVGEWGGTCGNVCGYCEDTTSCAATGAETFDNGAWNGNGNCGMDELGPVLCVTVMWTCV